MEEMMKEIHTLFCCGSSIKESQVFVNTLQHLLTTETNEHDATKTRCWATPQRWLLTLETPSLRAALWNPSTKKKVELPSMEKDLPQNCKCLLSREPGSPAGCVVLVVDDDEPVIWFCHVGAAVEGKFYFDVSSSKLGVLDFLPGPTFTMMETKRVKVSWDSWEQAFPHLVESRGGLYLFVITHNTLASIALYKMDFSSFAWSKVDRVYDQVFLLGRLHSTASYSAWELGLAQGNVYYLGPYELLNVFSAGDKHRPRSNCIHGDDLPAPLQGIYDVLTTACAGFTIGIGSS